MLTALVVLMNLDHLRQAQAVELTTSAALMLMGFAGILCGLGHTLSPAAIAAITTALLAWKTPLSGFSLGLTELELRAAILFAVLACVIYPALPAGTVDPWGTIEPRAAWLTVLLLAGISFVNYVLWKIYGSHGVELTGFLGGLVNSTVTVGEMAAKVKETEGGLAREVCRGVLLATSAMLVRNAVLLLFLAPALLAWAALASMAAQGVVPVKAGGTGVVLACLASTAVNLPLLGRSGNPAFIRRAGLFTLLALALGLAGLLAEPALARALGG
jgi:uncharacterized membrane protein (DUF4010 family)